MLQAGEWIAGGWIAVCDVRLNDAAGTVTSRNTPKHIARIWTSRLKRRGRTIIPAEAALQPEIAGVRVPLAQPTRRDGLHSVCQYPDGVKPPVVLCRRKAARARRACSTTRPVSDQQQREAVKAIGDDQLERHSRLSAPMTIASRRVSRRYTAHRPRPRSYPIAATMTPQISDIATTASRLTAPDSTPFPSRWRSDPSGYAAAPVLRGRLVR
jgi:hypothetical protein